MISSAVKAAVSGFPAIVSSGKKRTLPTAEGNYLNLPRMFHKPNTSIALRQNQACLIQIFNNLTVVLDQSFSTSARMTC
jgi:hypothetical protein